MSNHGMQNDGKVVNLHRVRNGHTLTPLRQAEAYWSALRIDGDIPKRSQIDPRGLESILENAFILERIAPGVARFRLAGQKVNDFAGMEVRGMPLTTFFSPSARIHISAALEHVFDAPAVAELTFQGKAGQGKNGQGKAGSNRPAPRAHMMLLPMRADNGGVSRALGVLVADDVKTNTPKQLSVIDTVLRPVSGFRHAAQPQTIPGFGDSEPPKYQQKPHLHLVT